MLSSKSTVLFSHFAQWFTDGFLRTDRTNSHEEHVQPRDRSVPGLRPESHGDATMLRSHAGRQARRARSSTARNIPALSTMNMATPKDEFEDVPILFPEDLDPARKPRLFAMGVERANVQIGYVMMNTLFLREHNRICDILAREHPDWDDERLFQTARNIVIVLVIKIVVEEYINHITPYHFKFKLDPTAFPTSAGIARTGCRSSSAWSIAGMAWCPTIYAWPDTHYPATETLFNNDLLTEIGLGQAFEDASLQPAGEIGLFNTPRLSARRRASRVSSLAGQRSSPATTITARCAAGRESPHSIKSPAIREVQQALKRLYGHVDNVEFYVGLFAEDVRPGSALAGADRPAGRDRCLFTGADQPAAGAADLQQQDLQQHRAAGSSSRPVACPTSCTATFQIQGSASPFP